MDILAHGGVNVTLNIKHGMGYADFTLTLDNMEFHSNAASVGIGGARLSIYGYGRK